MVAEPAATQKNPCANTDKMCFWKASYVHLQLKQKAERPEKNTIILKNKSNFTLQKSIRMSQKAAFYLETSIIVQQSGLLVIIQITATNSDSLHEYVKQGCPILALEGHRRWLLLCKLHMHNYKWVCAAKLKAT